MRRWPPVSIVLALSIVVRFLQFLRQGVVFQFLESSSKLLIAPPSSAVKTGPMAVSLAVSLAGSLEGLGIESIASMVQRATSMGRRATSMLLCRRASLVSAMAVDS